MTDSRTDSTATVPGVTFNPFADDFIEDPFPILHRLRQHDPVHRSDLGFWVLTRYDDVSQIIRDPRFRVAFGREGSRTQLGDGAAFAYVSRRMSNYNPPDHTRLRSLVTKAFTVKRVESMRPHIQAIADELLDRVRGRHQIDVLEVLAHPLPSLIICEMLGVPEADRSRFSGWTEDIAFLIAFTIEPERLVTAEHAAGEFMDYVRALITARRRNLGNDLLSALIAAEESGDRLSEDELVATVVFLFSAGHQTTRDLTGNALIGLLRHLDQRDLLAANPALLPEAVEECLRFDPSVPATARRPVEDVSIRGRRIPAGERVHLSLSAANRDPSVFVDPDRFDIKRPFKEHVTFGGGIHYCLGAALARVELQIIFGTLLRRYPRMRLADVPIRWRKTISFRGPLGLEVVL